MARKKKDAETAAKKVNTDGVAHYIEENIL